MHECVNAELFLQIKYVKSGYYFKVKLISFTMGRGTAHRALTMANLEMDNMKQAHKTGDTR